MLCLTAAHLDVHLVQVLMCEVLTEVRGQWGVNQHQAVQLTHVLRNCQSGNAVKHAQRVALVQELLQQQSRAYASTIYTKPAVQSIQQQE